MIDTLRTYAEKAKNWLTEEADTDYAEYDYGHIADYNYQHITTFVIGDDMPENNATARCDLCGKYFWDMELCIEHVGEHDDDVGDSINPFKETTEGDSWKI